MPDHSPSHRPKDEQRAPSIAAMMNEIADLRAQLATSEREILERAIDRMGWPEIHAYQAEMRKGQGIYEDAGGYFIRGLRRLFGLPQIDEEVITYQKAARAMVAKASERDINHG